MTIFKQTDITRFYRKHNRYYVSQHQEGVFRRAEIDNVTLHLAIGLSGDLDKKAVLLLDAAQAIGSKGYYQTTIK